MMFSKDFSSIIESLDESNSGVVWKELRNIGVGMSDGLGEGIFNFFSNVIGGFHFTHTPNGYSFCRCFSFSCHIKI